MIISKNNNIIIIFNNVQCSMYIKNMQDIIERLEKVVNKLTNLTNDKKIIYVLEEIECYDGFNKIKACYDDPDKVYEAACDIIDWVSFSSEDLFYLGEGSYIESDEVGNRLVKVSKFALL
jgi:hypothetical protein